MTSHQHPPVRSKLTPRAGMFGVLRQLYLSCGRCHDDRITNLFMVVLAVAMPFLFAGAIMQMPVSQ